MGGEKFCLFNIIYLAQFLINTKTCGPIHTCHGFIFACVYPVPTAEIGSRCSAGHARLRSEITPWKVSKGVRMPSLFLSKNDTCIWSSVMLELELPPSGSALTLTAAPRIHKERNHRCLKLNASILIN